MQRRRLATPTARQSDESMRVLIAGKNELAVGLHQTLMEADIDLGYVTCKGETADGPRQSLKAALAEDGVEPLNRSYSHKELLRVVRQWQPDVLISAGFDKIVRPDVIDAVPHALNVHFGELPRYRGSFSIPWAILNREAVVGVSLH